MCEKFIFFISILTSVFLFNYQILLFIVDLIALLKDLELLFESMPAPPPVALSYFSLTTLILPHDLSKTNDTFTTGHRSAVAPLEI